MKEREEISCENIFIDGTKIEANANRYSFVWGKAVAKNKAKLENKAESYLAELREEYSHNYEQCEEILAKSSQYAEYQEILGDRNSFSKTDHDATFMRMKDDHISRQL